MSVRWQLAALLADGRFHSGQTLAARLGTTRSELRRQLHALAAHGLALRAVPGRGYRLLEPVELLDSTTILATMEEKTRAAITALDVLPVVDSTNAYVLLRAQEGAPSGYACLAEYQQSGRGRRGRHWVSPFGRNIYLSLLWRFPLPPQALAGLSLAVGVATARAVATAGAEGVSLKWPNDVLWAGRKLAGILIELAGTPTGPCHAVVGVGLNVRMDPRAAVTIDQPWTDLFSILGRPVSRNRLAGLLLQHLALALGEFEQAGLRPFLQDWAKLDAVAGKEVTLRWQGGKVSGLVQGVGPAGELILYRHGKIESYPCGEVTLRASA